MCKNIKYLLFLIMMFSIVFNITSWSLKPEKVIYNNINKFYKEKDDFDVVLIGGSSTYVYFSPLEAWNKSGFKSYNYAYDAMSPALIKNLIKECQKYQSPKLYVIDLRAFEVRERNNEYYTESYLRRYTDGMKYSLNRIDAIDYSYNIEHPELLGDLSIYVDILRYHNEWKILTIDKLYDLVFAKPLEYKGFVFNPGTIKVNNVNYQDYSYVNEEKEISDKSKKVLNDLLNYCDSLDCEFLFTFNIYKMQDQKSKEWTNYIKNIIEERGYNFLDTNDYYNVIGINDKTDFYNDDHVNLNGAIKYTDFMVDYIEKNYDLPDNKENIKYNNWNIAYNKYSEEVKKALEVWEENAKKANQ